VLERQGESLPGVVCKHPRRHIVKSDKINTDITMDHSPSQKKR
jgi:hypothetical protein